jgi:hypothetical protein
VITGLLLLAGLVLLAVVREVVVSIVAGELKGALQERLAARGTACGRVAS